MSCVLSTYPVNLGFKFPELDNVNVVLVSDAVREVAVRAGHGDAVPPGQRGPRDPRLHVIHVYRRHRHRKVTRIYK